MADYLFEAFVKLTPGQQDSPPTALADQTNVYAKAHDFPFIAAARMFFSQAHDVADVDSCLHDGEL
jgi:hypothetical protein